MTGPSDGNGARRCVGTDPDDGTRLFGTSDPRGATMPPPTGSSASSTPTTAPPATAPMVRRRHGRHRRLAPGSASPSRASSDAAACPPSGWPTMPSRDGTSPSRCSSRAHRRPRVPPPLPPGGRVRRDHRLRQCRRHLRLRRAVQCRRHRGDLLLHRHGVRPGRVPGRHPRPAAHAAGGHGARPDRPGRRRPAGHPQPWADPPRHQAR